MCVVCNTDNELHIIQDALTATEYILNEYLRVPISKATELDDPASFDKAVAALSAKLRRATQSDDAAALRDAIAVLDVDWTSTTATQRRSLIGQAMAAAGRATQQFPEKISTTFGAAANDVVRATRNHSRQVQNLGIAADFNALDRRIVDYLKTSHSAYVRNEYGRRLDQFGVEARRIVSEGLESGLGRQDISRSLEAAAKSALVNKSPYYWEVVAGAFTSTGRSFAQMSAYAEAGIERYTIEAVLDERTTETCRFLHGKSFTVKSALDRFDRIAAMDKPEDIKQVHPWVRESINPDTGNKQLYVTQGDDRIPIAEVTKSAFGTKDTPGEFRSTLSEKDLNDLGIGFPPYHGLCRTTTVAHDST